MERLAKQMILLKCSSIDKNVEQLKSGGQLKKNTFLE